MEPDDSVIPALDAIENEIEGCVGCEEFRECLFVDIFAVNEREEHRNMGWYAVRRAPVVPQPDFPDCCVRLGNGDDQGSSAHGSTLRRPFPVVKERCRRLGQTVSGMTPERS